MEMVQRTDFYNTLSQPSLTGRYLGYLDNLEITRKSYHLVPAVSLYMTRVIKNLSKQENSLQCLFAETSVTKQLSIFTEKGGRTI